MKKIIKSIGKETAKFLIVATNMFYGMSFMVYAKSEEEAVEILKETSIYKGGMSFIGAATTILVTIIDLVAVVFFLVQGLKYMNAEEELKAKHKKRAIEVILVAAILTAARVVIPAVISKIKGEHIA